MFGAIFFFHNSNSIKNPEMETRARLLKLRLGILSYIVDHSALPPNVEDSHGEQLYKCLTSETKGIRYLEERPTWDTSNKLFDQWGNDFKEQMSITTNSAGKVTFHVAIWSCGRNRENEFGKGDDIIEAMDIPQDFVPGK